MLTFPPQSATLWEICMNTDEQNNASSVVHPTEPQIEKAQAASGEIAQSLLRESDQREESALRKARKRRTWSVPHTVEKLNEVRTLLYAFGIVNCVDDIS